MVRPKKYFGQHFLTDPGIARKIADLIPENEKSVLEIGPGKGILTRFLFERGFDEFYAVEIDPQAVTFLKNHWPEHQTAILEADFLKTDVTRLFHSSFYITGNFPYNISNPILFRAIEFRDQISGLTGMFQREVARRVTAEPGNKEYGILSVLLRAWFEPEYCFTVAAGSFFPPPKVQSAVIRLTRKKTPGPGCDEKLFVQLVKTAFNQRRKTLRNALRSLIPDIKDPSVEPWMSCRAEELSTEDFVLLTNAVSNLRGLN
ncbi:MAG: 16S rRNA (adenine(1518)-N(6)/adenine(1519)-N(6)) -dimethyltransferase RsmA [Bacteroidales bacterium]